VGLLQDYIDDQRSVHAWSAARPNVRTEGLTLSQDPQAAGRVISVARWPRAPCSLPAADCFEIEGPNGEFVRVWVDRMLDTLSAETVPLPGAWPPRFLAAGGLPLEQWPKVKALGRVVR
tara:strand:+ start:176 stop:532 length:357 start_codon:yes stop_codon:yes gene_type:complete